MSEETESTQGDSRGWLEKLSHLLSREPQNREQLLELLRDAEDRHLLEADSLEMIEGVLQVSDIQARDIMVPRGQMIVIEHDVKLDSFLPLIMESKHSRFPVIVEDKDEVLGILHAKELLPYIFHKDTADFTIADVLRPAVMIPESKRLNILLTEFKSKHNHMAIVVDEYGGVSGLITIEDVLEEIVGEIEDEFDVEEDENIKTHASGLYSVKALTPIEEFNEYFECDFSDEEFDTIGGLVTHEFGHLAKADEVVEIGKFQFKITHADDRRIIVLEVNVSKEN